MLPTKKILAGTLLFAGAIISTQAALDLTPNEIKASNDGPPAKRYFFRDADKRLTFRIDDKMSVSGGSGAIAFLFQDINGAIFKMAHSPLGAAVPFDEKNLPAYLNAARSFVPADATEVKMDAEVNNPISINRWTSHQYSFSYKLFGFAHRRSIIFLNYSEAEQLVLEVSAGAADYEKTYARGYRVLNSISDTPVNPDGPT